MDLNNNDNEFTTFASSIAFQLQKFPQATAYELMGDIQKLMALKLKNVGEQRFIPISASGTIWQPQCNESTPISLAAFKRATASSTPSSGILSAAISDAEIDFNSD